MAQLPSQRLIKPRVGLGAPAGVGVGGETAQQLRAGVIVLPEPVLRLRRGGGGASLESEASRPRL